jgi:hypothetical protein
LSLNTNSKSLFPLLFGDSSSSTSAFAMSIIYEFQQHSIWSF